MRKAVFYLASASILLMAISVLFAQDARNWASAKKLFSDNRNNLNPDKRAQAAQQLSEAIYPNVEGEAAGLFIDHIIAELGRAKGSLDKEGQIRFQVLEACVNGLKKMTQATAIGYLVRVAQDENIPDRVRLNVIQALSAMDDLGPVLRDALVRLIDDKWLPIRCAAIEGLTQIKKPETPISGTAYGLALERIGRLLNEDVSWELKAAAMDYLEKVVSKTNPANTYQDLAGALIKALQDKTLEGTIRIRIIQMIKQLGSDASVITPTYNAPRPILYYGIRAKSDRIIFILDVSDSMAQAVDDISYSKRDESQDPDNKNTADTAELKQLRELKSQADNKSVVSRFDAAAKELINTIYYLDPSVQFTMIFFDTGQNVWKGTLVPATIENKMAAIEYIRQKVSIGKGTGLYDALELAYKFVSAPAEKPNSQKSIVQLNRNCNYLMEFGGADTFWLVTSGAPTTGKIIDKEDIINEMKKITPIRNVRINTVAMGEPPLNPMSLNPRLDVDVGFLGRLADITGGAFTDKTAEVKRSSGKR